MLISLFQVYSWQWIFPDSCSEWSGLCFPQILGLNHKKCVISLLRCCPRFRGHDLTHQPKQWPWLENEEAFLKGWLNCWSFLPAVSETFRILLHFQAFPRAIHFSSWGTWDCLCCTPLWHLFEVPEWWRSSSKLQHFAGRSFWSPASWSWAPRSVCEHPSHPSSVFFGS